MPFLKIVKYKLSYDIVKISVFVYDVILLLEKSVRYPELLKRKTVGTIWAVLIGPTDIY